MTQSNTHNATVLVISSQVIDGQVGIQAIAPGLRAFGLGCIGLPTTLLAAHPAAYPQAGPPAGGALPAAHITEFAEWLLSAGAFEGLAGVLTGYMPSVEHVEATAGAIDLLRAQKPDLPVCCDPICGDNDRLYLPREVAAALGEHLLPRAGIATPNLFEWGHLTGIGPLEQTQDAARAALKLNVPEVIVTSAPGPKGRVATLLVSDQLLRCETVAVPQVPHGMGDLFSALYM
ncbi:MAG: bifunctional hydroxymethylpyrimidine kinase/phosphomethylpyrimidine kinase, partial [Pseudomonadota bacterium]|nr:bifunctional hydroxymethylpyrimidine kinase/phosphomethylpyrimidine kinase [Pseudomonadota bacterium]